MRPLRCCRRAGARWAAAAQQQPPPRGGAHTHGGAPAVATRAASTAAGSPLDGVLLRGARTTRAVDGQLTGSRRMPIEVPVNFPGAESTCNIRGGRTRPVLGRSAGITAVFLHGLGSSSRSWDKVVDLIADVLPTVTFDMPGHGDSKKPFPNGGELARTLTPRALAALASIVAEQETEGPVVYVGAGLGADAMLWALEELPRMSGALLVGGPTACELGDLAPLAEDAGQWFFDNDGGRARAAAFVAAQLHPARGGLLIDDRLVADALAASDIVALAPSIREHAAKHPPPKAPRRAPGTIDFVQGDDDAWSADTAPLLAAQSGVLVSSTEPVSQAGHLLHWERPEEVAARVLILARAAAGVELASSTANGGRAQATPRRDPATGAYRTSDSGVVYHSAGR